MLKFLLLFSLVNLHTVPLASQQVTGAQLEALLNGAHSRPDRDLAKQLARLQVTERLTSARLARCRAAVPGPEARLQLLALADAAAFDDLSPEEIPGAAAPAIATQREWLAATVNYVTRTVHQLPNFSATRTTSNFQGGPDKPWSFISKSSANVLYRKGEESLDRSAGQSTDAAQGLSSSGEFGPILGTVMLDAAQSSNLSWSHWEQGAAGLMAVFRFSVPAARSHYELSYCCIMGSDTRTVPFRAYSGYHGEIGIDPANGAILRLVLRADLQKTDPLVKANLLVEYDPVEIGAKSYLCPVKSVAYSVPGWSQIGTWLNDTVFERYHVFRSESRVLPAVE